MLHQLTGKLFVLAFVTIMLPIAIFWLVPGFVPPHPPSTATERAAAAVATDYVKKHRRMGFAGDRSAWITERRGQWEISFPPPTSITHSAGPILTMDKETHRVLHTALTD